MKKVEKSLQRWGLAALVLGLLLCAGVAASAHAAQRMADPFQGVAPGSPAEVAAACKAVAWLHTQQLPDGGFGQRLANGGFQSSAGATANAVYVLALLGEDPAGPSWSVNGPSALDALAKLAPDYARADAGQAGMIARAVAVAGGNPRKFAGMDLVAMIQAAYDPISGRYHPLYAYRNTLAIEGLLRSGVEVPQAALTAMFKAQLPDGGWFWSFEGSKSDVDTTGRVLQVLAGIARQQHANAYSRAADYLARFQLAQGGWNVGYQDGPANANSTALAVGGLWAAGFDPQGTRFQKNGRGATATLLGFQERPGSFAYIRSSGQEEVRLLATTDALAALAPRVVPPDTGQIVCQKPRLPWFFWR